MVNKNFFKGKVFSNLTKTILFICFFYFYDQITKLLVRASFPLNEELKVINNFFSINHVANTGGAFSLFSGKWYIFFISFILVIPVLTYFLKYINFEKYPFFSLSLTMIYAGAVGNFTDRIIFREVTDFYAFTLFKYHFAIFNVADLCLSLGMTILIIEVLFGPVGERWKN